MLNIHLFNLYVCELQNLADTIIRFSPCPTPGRGLPLGVEPSQQEMVSMPSKIDQWIKCQARVHCAAHYMDDYILIFPTVDEAKLMGHEIVRRFEAAGIRVNKRKCKVIPLTKPFRFCKARFTLTETGKIKVNGSRDGVKRARRKLKLFHREFKEGKRSFFDIEQYMECQSAYDFFTQNDDGMGQERGELLNRIIPKLEKRDAGYQARWGKIWEDALCQKYKRPDQKEHWIWNFDFYNGPVEDLRHIAALIGA